METVNLLTEINPRSAVGRCLGLQQKFDSYAVICDVECQEDCCACCYDYFYVSEAEFYTILFYIHFGIENSEHYSSYIDELSKRARKLSLSLKKGIPEEYEKIYGVTIKNSTLAYHLNPLIKGLKYSNTPCIFLTSENKCSVYPVRPFICRMFGTVTDTTLGDLYKCEKAKYNKTLDYSKSEIKGEISQLPIIGGKIRLPRPLSYWFDVIVPILKYDDFATLQQMYTQDYERL